MKALVAGFTGWAQPHRTRSPHLRVVDTAITVTGVLLLATTWVLLHP